MLFIAFHFQLRNVLYNHSFLLYTLYFQLNHRFMKALEITISPAVSVQKY